MELFPNWFNVDVPPVFKMAPPLPYIEMLGKGSEQYLEEYSYYTEDETQKIVIKPLDEFEMEVITFKVERFPNHGYERQLAEYDKAKLKHSALLEEWVNLKARWDVEEDDASKASRYSLYMRLKAEFEFFEEGGSETTTSYTGADTLDEVCS